ncbi:MAG TPA: tetratricopeptide repeat protein [Ktedonobacterales bacterium]
MESESLRTFGDYLKECRGKLGKPAAQVAADAKITPAYLYMLEGAKGPRGGKASRPSLAVLERLAAALKVPYANLCERAGYTEDDITSAPALAPRLTLMPPPRQAAPAFDDGMLIPPPRLIGREDELERILGRLRSDAKPRVVSIEGMAGVGKTALAAVAIQQVRAEGIFGGDIVAVPLQDELDVDGVLQMVLERFDPENSEPGDADTTELKQVARQLLSSRRALIVLDNIEPGLDIKAVVQPLREAGATLLLCARHTLPRDVVPIEAACSLHELPVLHALDLFALSYGRSGAADLTPTEQQGAEEIVQILKGNALAVKLVGAYALDVGRDLRALARELKGAPQQMLALAEEASPEIQAAFRKNLDALPEDAQRLFAALSAFGTEEFGRKAALAVVSALGSEPSRIDLLVRRAMLSTASNPELPEKSDHERLQFHPLLQAFAELTFAERPAEEQAVVHRAIADFYAEYSGEVEQRALKPDDDNIAHAIHWARGAGDDRRVSRLCAAMSHFWHDHEHLDDINDLLPGGIEAAARLLAALPAADESSSHQALTARTQCASDLFWMTLTYGSARRAEGKLDEATRLYERSLELARTERLTNEEGIALIRLGRFCFEQGNVQEAEAHFTRALTIHQQNHKRALQASVEVELGRLALLRGQPDEAEDQCHRALQMARVAGDRKAEGRARMLRGQIALYNGELDAAAKTLRSALELHREMESGRDEILTLVSLGDVALQRTKFAEAEDYYQQANDRAEGSWYPREQGVIIGRRGSLARLRGQLDDADIFYQRALVRAEEVQDDQTQAAIYAGMGQILLQSGRLDVAERRIRRALTMHHQLEDHPSEAQDLALLGQVALAREQFARAEEFYRQALDKDREITNRRGEGNDLFRLGELALRQANLDQARTYFTQALAAHRDTDNRHGEARTLAELATVARQASQADQADAYLRDALALMDEVHDEKLAEHLQRLVTEVEASGPKGQRS